MLPSLPLSTSLPSIRYLHTYSVMDKLIYWGTVFLVAAVSIRLLRRAFVETSIRLPPGPPAIPFIGHARIMPQATEFPWKTFSDWGNKWGE